MKFHQHNTRNTVVRTIALSFLVTSLGVLGSAWNRTSSAHSFPTPILVRSLSPLPPTPCAAAPFGLTAWYPDEGNANDIENGFHGTLRNGTLFGPGEVGQAFSFDGVDDYVDIPDITTHKPASLTVEAWVKFNSLESVSSTPGLQYIIFKKNTRTLGFEGYTLIKDRVAGSDRFAFIITSAADEQIVARSTNNITAGVWYHIAATYDHVSAKLYVNGALAASTPATFALDYSTRPLVFGSSGETFDGKLNGLLDEVSIYSG